MCDEIGYLSYDNRNADLFFQVVSRRYENKSLLLTTNLAFSDWPTVFPNASLRRRPHRPRRPTTATSSPSRATATRKREAEVDVKARKKRPAL